MIPSTRRRWKVSMTAISRSGSLCEAVTNMLSPASPATSSTPAITSVKNGSSSEVTTSPMVPLRCAFRLRATALGMYPISRASRWIRALVAALTSGLSFSARETVEWETPAASAMSLIETRAGVTTCPSPASRPSPSERDRPHPGLPCRAST